MKSKPIITLSIITLVLISVSPVVIQACYPFWFPRVREIDAIVQTTWLAENLETPGLVVLDVRHPDAYVLEHIPGAINVWEPIWYINYPGQIDDLPWMEMPDEEFLKGILGGAGISKDSLVVLVGSTSGPLFPVPFGLYNVAGISRVAITLLYAGVRNVAILDGGHDLWVAEGRTVVPGMVSPTPVSYDGKVDEKMVVSMEYVLKRIREQKERRYLKSVLVDARDPEVYFGVIDEGWPFVRGPGHIPTAKNLPTPWLWNLAYNATGNGILYATYKDATTLRDMALGVVGWGRFSREIIVYCGVGGYASTMYFVISEVLGYHKVRLYDGSWQEWATDPDTPIVLYEWE